jgi:NADH:ubiquinone oxidoreductase subunit 6 (subunit J)
MPVDAATVVVQAVLLASAVGLYGLTLLLRDLIRAIASFAIGSVLIAAAFFVLQAPFAGVFELTVGAGLVAVLFLAAITLTGGEARAEEGAP